MFTQEDLKNIRDRLEIATNDPNRLDFPADGKKWQSMLDTLDKVESLLDSPEKEVITVGILKQVLSAFDEDMEVFVCINEEHNGEGGVVTHNIFLVDEHREGCGIFI